MRQTVISKLEKCRATLEAINHAGWTRGHTWTADLREYTERVQDETNETYERCRRVLNLRYGMVV